MQQSIGVIMKSLFSETDIVPLSIASKWASDYIKKDVTNSNILYLVNYGKIENRGTNSKVMISLIELKNYYNINNSREREWKSKLGEDLNWNLSFDFLKEADTTKHVHRLHPYKGKFIPQLVEYFLDSHTDDFKKESFFNKGDIILDPFCGSGTTLIQASEMGFHSIGIDISEFNTFITNTKLDNYDLFKIDEYCKDIRYGLNQYIRYTNILDFENELNDFLSNYNKEFFPSPEFKRRIQKNQLNEKEYSRYHEEQVLKKYFELVKKHKIDLRQNGKGSFLNNWYLSHIRNEMEYVKNKIDDIKEKNIRNILYLILSRTVRSCRATTHSDLATLKEPVKTTYYCRKHKRICKPVFTLRYWWDRYCNDTIKRLETYSKIKKDTFNVCLTGDSSDIDIIYEINKISNKFARLLQEKKISGIFTSPPYVGLIDYHEQHAYAYELFGFKRRDKLEIGSKTRGASKSARDDYVKRISSVLINSKEYLKKDFNIFIVANDKFGLYNRIAEISNLRIVNKYKRPVLNRTEKNKDPYSEIIFHLKEA